MSSMHADDLLSKVRTASDRFRETDELEDAVWMANELLSAIDQLDDHLSRGGDLPTDWEVKVPTDARPAEFSSLFARAGRTEL